MRLTLPVLCLGYVSLVCLPQASGQENATDKARASFYAGIDLFKEGSFEAALAELQKAYELSPSYRVLYNIGLVYVELRDHVNAYTTLQNYLQQGGEDIPAARRAQVDELIRKLEKRIARVEIDCNVEGADVRVDDISVGKSPLAAPLLVNAGPRRFSVVKPGFPVAARIVTLAGEEQANIKLELVSLSEAQPAKPAPPAQGTLSKPLPPTSHEPEQKPLWTRTGFVVSLTVAGGCALATGIFGWRLLVAKNEFDRIVSHMPYDRAEAESVRSRAMAYQVLTYGFGAATLVSGGLALYLSLEGESRVGKQAYKRRSIALSATVNGVVVHGNW
jgi:tetratricopeptide (TPR) repeat protein